MRDEEQNPLPRPAGQTSFDAARIQLLAFCAASALFQFLSNISFQCLGDKDGGSSGAALKGAQQGVCFLEVLIEDSHLPLCPCASLDLLRWLIPGLMVPRVALGVLGARYCLGLPTFLTVFCAPL